ncbi:TPA: hypothetical protein M2P09_001191 [Klebsiella quasipneumoniae]|nr:hypothetical protein [Klebsiella quasipneumoniae]
MAKVVRKSPGMINLLKYIAKNYECSESDLTGELVSRNVIAITTVKAQSIMIASMVVG